MRDKLHEVVDNLRRQGHLTAEMLDHETVRSLIEAAEFEVALEIVCTQLFEYAVQVTKEDGALLAELHELLPEADVRAEIQSLVITES